ncbi:MAG TPA: hypothetical protein VHK27_09260 [Gammaproteobacteria bacterium]|nr:hypothetical protein [Gammaproteobacteria bacterium]
MLTYAQALRAIGQDLQGHGALAYEIDVSDAEFRVQCDCDLPPPGNLLSLCYTSRILEQIDFMGKLKRTGVSSVNSPESLPDTLRTLGAYVDRENGRLLRIANYELSGPEIAYRVEFALPDGSRMENTLSKPALEGIANSLRQQRK